MKINFSTVLNDLNDNPLQFAEGGTLRPMELRDSAIEALMSTSNSLPDGEAKFKVYELAKRLHEGGDIDLKPEEAALLKEKIGVAYGANVVGPSYELLNG